jgi:leucyl aminopeptidase
MRHYSTMALLVATANLFISLAALGADTATVKEVAIDGPDSVAIKVRMEGPYTADVMLQVVCYFKYTEVGAKRMSGAPVELDKRLGGIINSLRSRGEFRGEKLETLVLNPKSGSIKAKALLLVGLGDEDQLSLETMEQVGRAALRQARLLHATKVGFAPLIRDQGNKALDVGAVGTAVVRGMLLAYDTDRRLQAAGLSDKYQLEQWWVEAGPAYFDDTVGGVRQGVIEAASLIVKRRSIKRATDAQ